MNIEVFKDKFEAALDTFVFVRHGRSPKKIVERIRFAPHYMRERHVMRILKRMGTTVDPAYVKHIKNLFNGTAEGTEDMPVCDVCLTAFEPLFKSDDGIVSTATTCAGCLRTKQKESEHE